MSVSDREIRYQLREQKKDKMAHEDRELAFSNMIKALKEGQQQLLELLSEGMQLKEPNHDNTLPSNGIQGESSNSPNVALNSFTSTGLPIVYFLQKEERPQEKVDDLFEADLDIFYAKYGEKSAESL